jgi:hypothetical protein
MQFATYLAVFKIFFYFLVSSKRVYVNYGFILLLLPVIANHFCFWYNFYKGTLDHYTFAVLIQLNLLPVAAQLIHLSKFQRRSRHRLFFTLNTFLVGLEYAAFRELCGMATGNLHLCPQLDQVVEESNYRQRNFVMSLFLFSAILTVVDHVVYTMDRLRNQNVNRRAREHSVPTLPRRMLWESAHWTVRRGFYLALGFLLYSYTIYRIEVSTVQHLHSLVSSLDGIRSKGDLDFILLGFVGACSIWIFLRYLTDEVTPSFAKRAICTSVQYSS